MGPRYLKDGQDFDFGGSGFGFTGSAVNPRAHSTMSQDAFGDDAKLDAASAAKPTMARGGPVRPKMPHKPPKAARAVLGALQIGKAIGQKEATMGGAGAPGALPQAVPPAMAGPPAPGGMPAMKKGGRAEKWIQKAVPKSHKGRLHRALGVPEGEPIPEGKLEAAEHSKNPHMRHMAQFAKNVKR